MQIICTVLTGCFFLCVFFLNYLQSVCHMISYFVVVYNLVFLVDSTSTIDCLERLVAK